jgi:hypothetical protein
MSTLNSSSGGGNDRTCTNVAQVFDVSSIDNFNRAMDVARAANTLKLTDLEAQALAKADAIFTAKVIDPEVLTTDPAIEGFSSNPAAAAYIMGICGKQVDVYGAAKAGVDEVARITLDAQRTDIDLALLLGFAADDITVRSEMVTTALQAAQARAVGREVPPIATVDDALPFFCAPCAIVLGYTSSDFAGGALGGLGTGRLLQIRVPVDPSTVFTCDNTALVDLCDTLMSGGTPSDDNVVQLVSNTDPCDIGYSSILRLREDGQQRETLINRQVITRDTPGVL